MKDAIWAIWNDHNKTHTNCGDWRPSKTGEDSPATIVYNEGEQGRIAIYEEFKLTSTNFSL